MGNVLAMNRTPMVLLVACVGTLALVASVVAAPPPLQLCGVCHGTFDDAADRGTLDIHLDEHGDAEWVERVPVEPAVADTVADSEADRDDLVTDAWHSWHVSDGEWPTNVTHTIENGDLVVTYSMPDLAENGYGNAWIIDQFDTRTTADRHQIGGAELRIHPPSGHAFTTDPRGADMRDGIAVWQGADTDKIQADLPRNLLLTYAPVDDRTGAIASYATVAATIGPQLLVQTVLTGVVPTAVLGISILGAVRYRRRLSDAFGGERYGTALTGGSLLVAALATGCAVIFDDPGWLVIAAGAIAYSGIVRSSLPIRQQLGPHRLLGVLVGWMAVVVLLVGVVAPRYPLLIAGPVVSALACAPLALARDTSRSPLPAAAAILIGPIVGIASVMPTTGLGIVVVGTYTLVAVVGAILAGTALLVWTDVDRRKHDQGGQPSNRTRTE